MSAVDEIGECAMRNANRIRTVQKPPTSLIRRIEEREALKKGMVAAIVPETGEYFLGASVVEAAKEAREVYPEGVFYFIRIGYPAVHRHRGGIRRV